jgi:hypothetical protein
MSDSTIHATGTITVHTYEPEVYDKSEAGMDISRIQVTESFSGDITGEGAVTFLQAGRPDGSGSFVGIERVTATIEGRHGMFLLQDTGTVAGGIVSGEWFVVPGSATGELAGLRGTGGFRANLGENAVIELDYWFE